MTLSVLENACLKKARMHPNYSEVHEKILYMLMHEKKHYAKNELLCFANYSEKKLDQAIKELEETGITTTKGWLVTLAGKEQIEETLISEIKMPLEAIKLNSNKRGK